MIEPRIYRAAFIPALLAVVLAMFSLESRPRALPQGLAADVLFDGRLAREGAGEIAVAHPDRRPGTPGNRATADEVETALRRSGFNVERTRFSHAGRTLENVVGRRDGGTPRELVVVAARDAGTVPDAAGSAADTAALLELARVFEGRPSDKSLVLASVDGSTLGEIGAEQLADSLGSPDLVDGVLVISDLGAASGEGPLIQAWSNDSRRAGIGLQRTAAESIRQELGEPVGSTGTFGQLARLSFPVGLGGQGPLLERGYDAVRISGSGELPPGGDGSVEAIDEDRLGGLGRATLRTITALDASAAARRHGPERYVTAVSQVMPGWALTLLAATLLLPALVAAIDAFARARRRGVEVASWLRWIGIWIAPFLAGYAAAELLALVGATPTPPPAPVAPDLLPLDGPALGVLAGVAAAMALAFYLARRLALTAEPDLRDPSAPGAGVALGLVAGGAAVALWLVNPYAALLAVPAVHLWLLACQTDPAPPRRVRLGLVVLGVLPPLLVAVYELVTLGLDPLSGLWYLLLLVTGHHVGPLAALIACVMLGAFFAAVEIARSGLREVEPPAREPGPPVYGPGSYAGPGSLGGTKSALRR